MPFCSRHWHMHQSFPDGAFHPPFKIIPFEDNKKAQLFWAVLNIDVIKIFALFF